MNKNYAYLDKYGFIHVSNDFDIANKNANSNIVETTQDCKFGYFKDNDISNIHITIKGGTVTECYYKKEDKKIDYAPTSEIVRVIGELGAKKIPR